MRPRGIHTSLLEHRLFGQEPEGTFAVAHVLFVHTGPSAGDDRSNAEYGSEESPAGEAMRRVA